MFVEAFDKKYGYKPEWGANNAYMQFAIWARMVEEAGSFYPPDVIKAYEKGETIPSTVGDVHFRAEDHQLSARSSSSSGKKPADMKSKEDYWEVARSRARRAADAEARRVRLQARRLHLSSMASRARVPCAPAMARVSRQLAAFRHDHLGQFRLAAVQRPGAGRAAGADQLRADDHLRHARRAQPGAWRDVHARRLCRLCRLHVDRLVRRRRHRRRRCSCWSSACSWSG